jgi:UDP-N-acetylmuramate dehydrogenase
MPSYHEQHPLAPHTTLGVGGPARYFAEITSLEELRAGVAFATERSLPLHILGRGSNSLIADEGFDGVVLKMALSGVEFGHERVGGVCVVKAAAGEEWDAFVASCVTRGLWGLENLSGIPGTVGAAPIQNINAYGASVSDTIESVEVFHAPSNRVRTLTHTQCLFGYRDSIFKQHPNDGYIVTGVTFNLSRTPRTNVAYRSATNAIERYFAEHNITEPSLADIREGVIAIRTKIGMVEGAYSSAGSFFTNTILPADEFARMHAVIEELYAEKSASLSPWYWELPDGQVKVSTAFLMECTPYNKTAFAGKAFRDRVGISPVHTLSIINLGGARAKDIVDFVEAIRAEVRGQFGVTLATEVCYVHTS